MHLVAKGKSLISCEWLGGYTWSRPGLTLGDAGELMQKLTVWHGNIFLLRADACLANFRDQQDFSLKV